MKLSSSSRLLNDVKKCETDDWVQYSIPPRIDGLIHDSFAKRNGIASPAFQRSPGVKLLPEYSNSTYWKILPNVTARHAVPVYSYQVL